VLDGTPLVDAHVHVPLLPTVRPAWLEWARDFGEPGVLEGVWDAAGRPRPDRLDALFAGQGVDVALLFCEYSPKATGMQHFDELLPLVEHNPDRFRPVANVNPHLHFPVAAEVRRQLALGAAALKLHPVHGGFRCDDAALYPAYQVLAEAEAPLVVHCGTSSFPGAANENADPAYLLPVLRDFPGMDVVLAHGGRGWWYDAAAFLALTHETVWIELSGLPPKRLPEYYASVDLARLARRWIFGTDWPGVPGVAANAQAVADLVPPELVPDVLAGNAYRVYRGLPGRPEPARPRRSPA
jgi:predicted TIM-barrel fold metal-dependent hydrolase